jgi:hypothetical protein
MTVRQHCPLPSLPILPRTPSYVSEILEVFYPGPTSRAKGEGTHKEKAEAPALG